MMDASDRRLDYIPISATLVEHVRRIDGFNDEELVKLKGLLGQVCSKLEPGLSLNRANLQKQPKLRRLLEVTLKLH